MLEIVAPGTDRHVPLLDLMERAGLDFFGDSGHPPSVRIVGDHEVAIGGRVDVDFERVGAVCQRPLESG